MEDIIVSLGDGAFKLIESSRIFLLLLGPCNKLDDQR